MMLKEKVFNVFVVSVFGKKMESEQMASTCSLSEQAVQDQPVIGKEQVTEYLGSLNTFNLTGPNGLILGYFQK